MNGCTHNARIYISKGWDQVCDFGYGIPDVATWLDIYLTCDAQVQ